MDAIEQAYQDGVARFGQGDHEAALALLSQIPKTNQRLYALALSYIGRIQTLRGEHDNSEKSLRRSLSLQTKIDPQTLYFLGECYFYQRKWDDAEKLLRECVVREPKYTDAYIRLGMVLKEQRRVPEATRAFEMAIVNDQKAVVARYQLAQICVEGEDYKRALSQLHVVKELANNYAPAFVLQGDIFQRIGDHRQSIVEYVKVVQMGKADAGLYWRLGRSFMAIKDRKQALKAFEEALRLDPRMWPACFYSAQLREELQHYPKAVAHYKALLEVDEYRAIAREAIARLTQQVGASNLSASGPDPLGDVKTFEPPPVTTKVAATHSLEAVQRQLTSEIGPSRTAPLKPANDRPAWVDDAPIEDDPVDTVAPVQHGGQTQYSGPDVVEQVSSALRSGAIGEVVSVLRNSSMEEIAGSVRSRIESHLDPLLKQVKIPKMSNLAPSVKDVLAKLPKKKP